MSSPEELPDLPHITEDHSLPEAGHDEGDPNVPSDDQEVATPPIANPTRDMEATVDDNDEDSELSDVDDAQFEDFDPTAVVIDDRPAVAIDEDNIGLIGRHKRKRVEGEEGEGKKKKKEARREKKKHRVDDDEDNFSGGEELSTKRRRKRAAGEDGEDAPVRQRRQETPDEELDPETRARRELDRKMDAALRNPNRNRRRKLDGIDVANNADADAKDLYDKMQGAAKADNDARANIDNPKPALQKLKLLPQVVAFLNRNGPEMENAIADNNVLEGVRFFLEPLEDGSMPAYNIQRDLFAILNKMQISKDTLISSQLGKLMIFYTKSKKVQPEITRQADRLLAEWTRPILKRSDNYRNRALETRVYDPEASKGRSRAPKIIAETAEERRKRELAIPRFQNRAQMDTTQRSYSIVPMSQAPTGAGMGRQGGAGDDAFKRLKARHTADQRSRNGLKPKKKGNAI